MPITSYLAAAVAANAIVSKFGPWALPFTAWVLIPFDLAARDILHDHWHTTGGLKMKMALLVLTGSLMSFFAAEPSVCIASGLSFGIAGAVDTVAYSIMFATPRLVRINGSNICSSIADSVAFPAIAFGVFSFTLTATQATSKIIGGALWSLVLVRVVRER